MKKTKKIVTIIFAMILIVIAAISTLFAVRYFKYATKFDVSDIEKMEISKNYYYPSFTTYTYKFNFDNNFIICEKEADDPEEETKFYAIDFTDEDEEYFMKKANFYGFFSWEGSYHNPNFLDGYSVSIYIEFKDGTVHKTHCYFEYPPNYDKIEKVFSKAFGKNIL